MRGKAVEQFNIDLAECQAYAQQSMDADQAAVAGAAAMAIVGAILAPRGYRNYAAGHGAMLGGLSGGVAAVVKKEQITKTCLAGRGYSVLN
jgi:hypothetical protein